MSELKSCPFCGGEVTYHTGYAKGNKDVSYRRPSITCERCGIGFSYGAFGHGISDEDAERMTSEAWNARKPTPLQFQAEPTTGERGE